MKLGCYFSVNVRMVSSPNGCRVFHEVPDNRILTEADGPFIERTEKSIELGDVRPALNGIAPIKGIAVDRLQAQVVRNLGDVISLPSGSAGRINLPKSNWVRSIDSIMPYEYLHRATSRYWGVIWLPDVWSGASLKPRRWLS